MHVTDVMCVHVYEHACAWHLCTCDRPVICVHVCGLGGVDSMDDPGLELLGSEGRLWKKRRRWEEEPIEKRNKV